MDIIALPKKIEFIKGTKPNQKQVIIESCYPGYGITIGNALRRVLLSSLPGAAVVGVKIKGANHEFMALPHIKEDILEIILNLKQLRLKVFTEEVVKLELEIRGEKEATAADIKKSNQVEIANPDLILAHITDMSGVLEMEIFVATGSGYITTENREGEKHEIGYIGVDSIFTPVLTVGINVENVRVGKMTNWDKLILDIVTDGTITPEDAFADATKILIKQFTALIGGEQIIENKVELVDEVAQEVEKDEPVEEVIEEAKQKRRGRPKKD